MSEIPLITLLMLEMTAKVYQMDEALAIVRKEISLNLEAAEDARKAKIWAEEQSRLLKEEKLMLNEEKQRLQQMRNLKDLIITKLNSRTANENL